MELSHLQRLVKDFTQDKGIESKVEVRIIDLVSELGELSKEILKSTNYGRSDFTSSQQFKEELGDVFFSLISIANESNTNLEESLKIVLEKYNDRFAQRGGIDSGR